MTQSLSNLMSSYCPAALLYLLVLLLILLPWAVYRYQLRKKRQVARVENHPAIPQRVYKISEVRQSSLSLSGMQKDRFNQAAAERPEAYRIPAGLWDV